MSFLHLTSIPPAIFWVLMKALRPSLKLPTRWSVYDEILRCEPFREWGGIATVAPLDLRGKVDSEAVEAIEAVRAAHMCGRAFSGHADR